MKNLLYLLFALFISQPAFSAARSWVGTTSDWATASNWSPSGIPGTSDVLTIDAMTNDPIIFSGTSAAVRRVFLQTGSTLTINSGASLTISNAAPAANLVTGLVMASCALINNGTLTVNVPNSQLQTVGIGMGLSTLTNSGIINTDGNNCGLQLAQTNTLTNTATGTINCNAESFGMREIDNAVSNISNSGILNATSVGAAGVVLAGGTFSNSGSIHFISGRGMSLFPSATLNNLSCGKIIFENADGNDVDNQGTINNSGLIQIFWWLKNSGGITNDGVIKYETLVTTGSGAIVNNGIIIDDKTKPVVQVGAGNSAAIEGIYKNSGTTTSAGTFSSPDHFTPSGLNLGTTTLYLKIDPSGGACQYIVPFLYEITALPVTLANFSGKKTGEAQITLTWLTVDEKNFDYFEVQRSYNAISFETIGTVRGTSGQVTAMNSYRFIDTKAGQSNYYRLKMVDRAADRIDGTYEFTRIISVDNATEKSIVGSFYPNPSGEQVFVDINAADSEKWHIKTYDSSGKVIATETRTLQKGMNKISLTRFAHGLNIIQFESGRSSISRKLVRK